MININRVCADSGGRWNNHRHLSRVNRGKRLKLCTANFPRALKEFSVGQLLEISVTSSHRVILRAPASRQSFSRRVNCFEALHRENAYRRSWDFHPTPRSDKFDSDLTIFLMAKNEYHQFRPNINEWSVIKLNSESGDLLINNNKWVDENLVSPLTQVITRARICVFFLKWEIIHWTPDH